MHLASLQHTYLNFCSENSTASDMSTEEQPAQACVPDELKQAGGKFEYGDKPESSIFARDDAPVHNVPMAVIRRPLPSELDEDKVLAFMEEMKVSSSPDLSSLRCGGGSGGGLSVWWRQTGRFLSDDLPLTFCGD